MHNPPKRKGAKHARCHQTKQKKEVVSTDKPSSLSPRSPPAPPLRCVAPRNLLARTLFTLLRWIQPTPNDPKRSPLDASCCPGHQSGVLILEGCRWQQVASSHIIPPVCPAFLFSFKILFTFGSRIAFVSGFHSCLI